MIWAAINIATGVCVAGIIIYLLAGYGDTYNKGEWIGKFGIATFSILRIGPILGRRVLETDTPFDDWTVTGLHISLVIYFVSRAVRVQKHWVRNEQQKRIAHQHLVSRGKI